MTKKVLFWLITRGSMFFRAISDSLARKAITWLPKGDQSRLPHPSDDRSDSGQRREIDEFRHDLLSAVMEMGQTVAKEVMVPRTDMVCVEAGLTLKEVLAVTADSEHSRIPVYEKKIDNIVGLLYSKDLLGIRFSATEDFSLRKILRPAYFIPETKPLAVLLREFQRNRVHIAIVVDEYGGTAGLVTLEDILEEIIGEIQDEYDETEEQITRLENGDYVLDARINIEQVEELLGISIEKEEFESLGGLTITILGHLPRQGEDYVYKGYRFVVEKATERKVVKIRVGKLGNGNTNISG